MSLLTEEQITEIINIATQQSEFAEILKLKLDHWNSNQKSTQVEPDWTNAHLKATKVYLESVWYNNEKEEIYRKTIYGWNRPVTPHPHAEMMAKYAEVAARRVDPWVEFERFSHCDMDWDELPYHPDWTQGQKYRHIGDEK